MKPFNIEAARRGEKVVTRDGRPVRIVCFNAKGRAPIIALTDEGVLEINRSYRVDGTWIGGGNKPDLNDLVMAGQGPEYVFNLESLHRMDKNRFGMLPFDLEAAQAGALMRTRDGHFARLLMSDCKGDLPLVALITEDGNEYACNYNRKGRIDESEEEFCDNNCDLFMLGVMTEGNY